MIGEHRLPGALRVQRGTIEQQPHCSFRICSGQNLQLLLCPVKLPGKQQKLEKERTSLDVERIGSQLVA